MNGEKNKEPENENIREEDDERKKRNKNFKEEEEDEENLISCPMRSQLALHKRRLLPTLKCCHMSSPVMLPLVRQNRNK